MAGSLQFELVSPEKLLIAKPVAMVTVPGGEGDYGVLAGHAPVITTLRPGVIEVFGESETVVTDRIFVAGGFAEVTGERVAVLAEVAIPVAELNRTEAEQDAKTLTDQLTAANENDRALLESQLAVAQAKLTALGG